ncbi:MAG TPA: hydroxyacid dehydrogenase [Firmicutes bacterium]|jgi:D-3-phosphoglycerate dehydrogenase|nr:hydroxyacid dehydrogenase [Bacillota bacterium]HAW71080.1 hydroxyacid dehydrogenase [Bacillota bacterium]HAZ22654.1 hydroxyacid dehydrogenase [Bacillota bacterium]HBG44883.1 hydroxyacid dehydrogenase [Bacillota bacterium]HBL50527.1 hydroxyacid dehydrogenase [Bacillota bacterium]
MTWRVLVTPRTFGATEGRAAQLLQEAGCELMRNPYGRLLTEDEMIALIPEADGIIIGLDPLNERVLERAVRLKVISKYGVGLDNIGVAAATARKIPVAFTPGTNSASVAELAFGLMLDAARHISASDRQIRQGQWGRFSGTQLWGKTLGLIGTGQIGQQLALRARGFEMPLLCYDARPDYDWAQRVGASYVELPELLRRSDFVSLHIPLSEATHHLIGAAELSLMKPTAIIINTSRGGIIDDEALRQALSEQQLGAAGLDVVECEPPQETPLARLDNVVLTSHIGAHTVEASAAMSLLAAENVVAALQGARPKHVANKEIY